MNCHHTAKKETKQGLTKFRHASGMASWPHLSGRSLGPRGETEDVLCRFVLRFGWPSLQALGQNLMMHGLGCS